MATADTTMDSGLTYFLFRQLLQSWYPDIATLLAQRIVSQFLVFQKTPNLQVPPLISILMSLADAPATAHEPAAKILPCGHFVHVRSILTCCNISGNQVRRKGPYFLDCPRPDCDTHFPLPMIPNPWLIDGLQSRLDLVQWAWAQSKGAPTNGDVNLGKLLRYILDHMGHLPRDLEVASSLPWRGPSHQRQRQTLRLLETEAAVLAKRKYHDGPRSLRGREPYCQFRPSKVPPPGYVQKVKYRSPSPGQYCICKETHEWARKPREWASTPAEDEEEWKFAIPRMEKSGKTGELRRKKTVRFAAPVITEVQYFEPWWRREYRDSDRYYSSGPCRTSVDRSTEVDDDREIARLDAEASAVGESKTRRRLTKRRV